MTEIRIACVQDAPELCRLEKECFSSPWSLQAVTEELALDTAFAVLCLDDGVPIGYGILSVIADEAELYRIGVIESHRRHGIGGKILTEIIRISKEKGAASIFLEVRASNSGAIGLYQNAGFATLGIRRNYYDSPCEDAVIMRKEV